MRLVLSRASPTDFDQLVPLAYRAFTGDPMTPVFFGYETPANHANIKKQWIQGSQVTNDVWMKIVDEDAEEVDVEGIDTGDAKGLGKRKEKKIVGACDWRVYPTFVPEKQEGEKSLEEEYGHLDTHQQRVEAKHVIEEYMAMRKEESSEESVFCYLLFVDPGYQRMGVGTMLMRWGNEVADQLMVPCWLESSSRGVKLYQKMGYVETNRKQWKTECFGRCECIRMKRARMVERMEGRELQRLP